MTYLDTRALIKRFLPKKGSPLVRALVRTDVIATAKIAYAEVYATLTRKKRHPLRGFDAVHLASALDLGTETREDITFVAADERLLRAAQAEGLTVINPEGAAARRR